MQDFYVIDCRKVITRHFPLLTVKDGIEHITMHGLRISIFKCTKSQETSNMQWMAI